jgi:hypothetical protein
MARGNNKRGFSGFNEGVYLNYSVEITHNRYNTLSRLIAHKRESSYITVADSALIILGCSLLTCAPESWSPADFTGRLLNHNWTISQLYLVRNSTVTELKFKSKSKSKLCYDRRFRRPVRLGVKHPSGA